MGADPYLHDEDESENECDAEPKSVDAPKRKPVSKIIRWTMHPVSLIISIALVASWVTWNPNPNEAFTLPEKIVVISSMLPTFAGCICICFQLAGAALITCNILCDAWQNRRAIWAWLRPNIAAASLYFHAKHVQMQEDFDEQRKLSTAHREHKCACACAKSH